MSSDYVKVFSGNSMEVQRMSNEFKYQGIKVLVKDEGESARLAGFGSPSAGRQDLYVLREQADRATAIVKEQSGG